jgi:hypothetical protein
MSNITAYFDFGDTVLGPFPLRTALPVERQCSDSFHHAVSQWTISFIPTTDYLVARAAAKKDIVVSILEDEVLAFKGLVAPTDSWTDDGATLDGAGTLNDVTLEVLDYSSWLEYEVKDEDFVAYEDAPICDPAHASTSIVNRLLTLCGLGGMFVATVAETTVLHAFSVEAGTTVASALDDLLFQWGLELAWKIDHFETSRWLIESPVAAFDFTEKNMQPGFKTERVARDADAVEVEWYALKDKANCLLYMADLPFNDEGQRSGYPIQPGLLWPEEANVEETWFDYEDTALAYSGLDSFGNKKKNTDFSSIMLTKNHHLDGKVNTGIVAAFAPIFQNKRARVAYKNPTTGILYIYYCDIYGDTIYRGAKNSVVKNAVASPKSTKTITAQYIFNLTQATKLACALSDNSSCWRFTITSESKASVGTVVSVYNPYQGTTAIARLVERSRDPETEIYTYKAISLSSVTINPTASYQAVLGDPASASSDARVQAAAALARSLALAKVVNLKLSTGTLARSRAGVFSPSSITAWAVYADDVAYLGRFVIDTSSDGDNWTNRYTSEADESSKIYAPNVACSYIRVGLFKAGGTVTLLRETTLTVTQDVSAAPVYWGPLSEDPSAGISAYDSYLVDLPEADGGGKIRFFNGSIWAEMLTTNPLYPDMFAKSMIDRLVWSTKYGVAQSGSTAVFEAIGASLAVINKLLAQYLKIQAGGSLRAGDRFDAAGLIADVTKAGVFIGSDGKLKIGGSSSLGASTGDVSIELTGQSLAWKRASDAIDLARLSYEPLTQKVRATGLVAKVASASSQWTYSAAAYTTLAQVTPNSVIGFPATCKRPDDSFVFVYLRSATRRAYYRTVSTAGLVSAESMMMDVPVSSWATPSIVSLAGGGLAMMFIETNEAGQVQGRKFDISLFTDMWTIRSRWEIDLPTGTTFGSQGGYSQLLQLPDGTILVFASLNDTTTGYTNLYFCGLNPDTGISTAWTKIDDLCSKTYASHGSCVRADGSVVVSYVWGVGTSSYNNYGNRYRTLTKNVDGSYTLSGRYEVGGGAWGVATAVVELPDASLLFQIMPLSGYSSDYRLSGSTWTTREWTLGIGYNVNPSIGLNGSVYTLHMYGSTLSVCKDQSAYALGRKYDGFCDVGAGVIEKGNSALVVPTVFALNDYLKFGDGSIFKPPVGSNWNTALATLLGAGWPSALAGAFSSPVHAYGFGGTGWYILFECGIALEWGGLSMTFTPGQIDATLCNLPYGYVNDGIVHVYLKWENVSWGDCPQIIASQVSNNVTISIHYALPGSARVDDVHFISIGHWK